MPSLLGIKDHNKAQHLSARFCSLDNQQLGGTHRLAQSVPIPVKLNEQMSKDALSLPDSSIHSQPNMPPLGTSSSTHVGFNDLPTELRLQIYKEALTGPSGALTFPSFSSQKKHGLATSLLATCSSISSCATPLLYTSNVFLLEVEASSNTDLGVFPTSLPMHVLPRIQHAFMVFDARHTVPYSSPRGRHHSNLDQMTGLKSLGISIITLREHVIDRIRWEGMLWTVVENVPKGCHLHFGATSDAEKAFVNRFIDSEGRPFSAAIEPFKDAYCMRPGRTNMNTFSALCFREANSGSVEVAEEVLNKTLKKIRALQSLKSG